MPEVQHHQIALAGLTMAVAEAGVGPPLVLLHGFPMDHSIWAPQLDSLSAVCRVIAPDLRGFGGSRGELQTVTMRRYADDLAAMLDALRVSEPVALAGLSMGGYIAMEFIRAYRRRLGALILIDTRAAADTAQAAQTRIETAERLENSGNEFLADSMLPRLFCEATLKHRPELPERLHEIILRGDPLKQAAASRAMAARIDSTETLAELDCPTLLIVGQHDAISPVAEMTAMADSIANSRLVIVEDAGHMAVMENPAAVNQAIAEFMTTSK